MKNLITIPAPFTIILQQQKTIYNYITIAPFTIVLQRQKTIYNYITTPTNHLQLYYNKPFTIVLQ
jgi:hypothetical protein